MVQFARSAKTARSASTSDVQEAATRCQFLFANEGCDRSFSRFDSVHWWSSALGMGGRPLVDDRSGAGLKPTPIGQ